jgi:hypothetical protein
LKESSIELDGFGPGHQGKKGIKPTGDDGLYGGDGSKWLVHRQCSFARGIQFSFSGVFYWGCKMVSWCVIISYEKKIRNEPKKINFSD